MDRTPPPNPPPPPAKKPYERPRVVKGRAVDMATLFQAMSPMMMPQGRRLLDGAREPAAVDFHGVALMPRGAGAHLLDALLSHFPAVAAGDRAPRLTLDIGPGDGTAPPCVELLSEHGAVSLYRSSTGLVVTSGTAWAEASVEPLAVRGQRAARRAQPCPEKEVFATALLLALRAHSLFDLHAAAAVAAELTVIAVGAPTSGKTTLCAALLEAGCHYLGDDRLLLRQLDGVLELLSFPAPFRLTAATAQAFPRLEPWLSGDLATGKRELDLERAFPARHAERATGRRCLLFPERAASSELSVLGPSEALGRLIAQSASLVVAGHPAPKAQLAALRALAQGSLTLRARLGPEWLENPAEAALTLLEQLEVFG